LKLTIAANNMPKGIGYKQPRQAKDLLGAFAEEVKKDRTLRKARNSGRGLAGRTRKRFTRSLNKASSGGGGK
jgi:hypothetical protein